MGNATSKAAKSANKLSATNAARKYPLPSSNRTTAQAARPSPGATAGPTVHPQTRISETRNEGLPAISHTSQIATNN